MAVVLAPCLAALTVGKLVGLSAFWLAVLRVVLMGDLTVV